MFDGFLKRRKIKKFARKMPLELKKLFGFQKFYTQGQVDTVLKKKKLVKNKSTVSDVCFAYAMYCSPQEFQRIHNEAGEECNYQEMREEVAATMFSGASDFSTSTLITEASISDSSFSSGGFSGSNGGDFGGGSDGGGGGD